MKALVTGAGGMLGVMLCGELKNNGYEVFPTDVIPGGVDMRPLDITDMKAVTDCIKDINPGIIFHAGAETDVDKCEREKDYAYKVNTLGTENIALACQGRGITMAYISTCGVFDGMKEGPYNEFDEPAPISIYTKSKYEGEKTVRGLLNRYFIFRAGWMIGGGKKDKKFVAKILRLLKTKNTLTVVNDKFGCPTYTKDFSQGLLKVVGLSRYGLYHITNEGRASRYDIACKIVEHLKKDNVTIKPISSAEFLLPAPRPRSEVVDNYKLKLLGIRMRPWEEALKEYLDEFNNEE
ncbi:MAG: dTDP-4-dehydrorhamnose reductase [Candidatus Omnitrophota bacterium]